MSTLRAYLEVPQPDPEVQWRAIEQRRRGRVQSRARRRIAGAAAAALVAVVGAAAAWLPQADPTGLQPIARRAGTAGVPAWAPSLGPTVEPRTVALGLGDGSTVRATPGTQVDVCRASTADTCVKVERGEAWIAVEPRQQGTFKVRAGRVEVRAQSTAFVVRRDVAGHRDEVSVEVQHGTVEVAADGRVAQTLVSGDVWTLSSRPASKPSPPRLRPDDLFDDARAHARAGRHEAAADAYARFLTRFNKNKRAPLAALELGRLRMDVLGDARGAIAPLRRAARSSGATREDAQARLIRALARVGRTRECASERATYLRQFPAGVHRRTVEHLCR